MSGATSDDVTLAGDPALVTDPRGRSRDGRLLPGAQVGRYIVLSRLGAGGMGVVHAAYDPELDRKVALKLLLPSTGGGTAVREEERQALKLEAQALAKLSHPNVIAIHDVGEHEGRVFIAMEFVDGATLGEWQEQAQPDQAALLEVFVRAGEGLAAAHAEGLVHRDFKPDNVMVSRDGRVRVMDFGLALSAVPGGLDAPGMMGTPSYMAPEQFQGKGIDARSDQFSFCVALWEAVAGTRPYRGRDVVELVANVLEGRRQEPGPGWAKLPPWVRRAVLRGLEVEPERRWPSMEALLHELARPPDRRRAKVLGAAALVTAAAGLWVGIRPEGSRCEAASATVAGAWDDERRAAVGQAMRGTEAPHADDTWSRVEAGLDAYATELSEIRHELCAHPPQDELAGERTVCLERRERALRSLVEVLEGADAAVVDEAVETVARLPELARCLDVAYLSAEVEPPADPEVAAQVERVRDRLARAEALVSAGKAEDAGAVLERAEESAAALGYEPLLGELELMRGTIARRRGRSREAVEQLEIAYERLLEIGHDEAAANAARQLASELGGRQANAAQGLAWVLSARALGRRAELGKEIEARLVRVVANIHLTSGDLHAAEAELLRARELAIEAHGPEHVSVYPIEVGLGTVYAQRGEIERAFEPLQRALRIAEAALGPVHPDVGAIVLNLGNLYVESGDLEQGRAHYARSLAITEGRQGPEHPRLVLVLNNLGSIEQQQGQLERAAERFNRALRIAEATDGADSPNTALTLINLSNLQRVQGDAIGSEASARRAVSIWERRQGPEPSHPHFPAALTNLGAALAAQERLDEARIALERSLRGWEALVGPEQPALVEPLRALSSVMLRLDRLEEALALSDRQLALLGSAEPAVEDRAKARALRARLRWSRGEDSSAALAEIRSARDVLAAEGTAEARRLVAHFDRWLAETPQP